MKKALLLLSVVLLFFVIQLSAQGQGSPAPDSSAQPQVITPAQNLPAPGPVAHAAPPIPCKECNSQLWISWVCIGVIVLLFLGLVYYSNMLRDEVDPWALLANAQASPAYAHVKDVSEVPRPFSLSRTQLGIWTVVIGSSYVYLSIKYCGQVIPISSSILSLMGISAGTAAVGNAIDKSQSAGQAGAARHQNQPSQGFLTDILSDQNGISIHRFQNVVFTLIAVVIYLYKICETPCGHLPELDPTLIGLNGISCVTYLGLKLNENKQA